jgi:Icc-related predicted phosphoesterase
LKLFIQGHIHEGYGYHQIDEKLFINASVLNLQYKMVNKPVVLNIDEEKKVSFI